MSKYWRCQDSLSINNPSKININGHVFIEHISSVNERKDNYGSRRESVIHYGYWGGGILTEPQIRERLAMISR